MSIEMDKNKDNNNNKEHRGPVHVNITQQPSIINILD